MGWTATINGVELGFGCDCLSCLLSAIRSHIEDMETEHDKIVIEIRVKP